MLNLGTDEMAKYPFLAEAGQYLKDKGFTLDQLIHLSKKFKGVEY